MFLGILKVTGKMSRIRIRIRSRIWIRIRTKMLRIHNSAFGPAHYFMHNSLIKKLYNKNLRAYILCHCTVDTSKKAKVFSSHDPDAEARKTTPQKNLWTISPWPSGYIGNSRISKGVDN
jgi:hypothetical protein